MERLRCAACRMSSSRTGRNSLAASAISSHCVAAGSGMPSGNYSVTLPACASENVMQSRATLARLDDYASFLRDLADAVSFG